jgi:hypothetical protein
LPGEFTDVPAEETGERRTAEGAEDAVQLPTAEWSAAKPLVAYFWPLPKGSS